MSSTGVDAPTVGHSGCVEQRDHENGGMANGVLGGECVLLAGGAGYIGSITAVQLVQDGYQVVVVDSLVNCRQGMYSNRYYCSHQSTES